MFSGADADRPFGVPPTAHAAYVTRTPIRRPRVSEPLPIPTGLLNGGQRSLSVLLRQLSHFINVLANVGERGSCLGFGVVTFSSGGLSS